MKGKKEEREREKEEKKERMSHTGRLKLSYAQTMNMCKYLTIWYMAHKGHNISVICFIRKGRKAWVERILISKHGNWGQPCNVKHRESKNSNMFRNLCLPQLPSPPTGQLPVQKNHDIMIWFSLIRTRKEHKRIMDAPKKSQENLL